PREAGTELRDHRVDRARDRRAPGRRADAQRCADSCLDRVLRRDRAVRLSALLRAALHDRLAERSPAVRFVRVDRTGAAELHGALAAVQRRRARRAGVAVDPRTLLVRSDVGLRVVPALFLKRNRPFLKTVPGTVFRNALVTLAY